MKREVKRWTGKGSEETEVIKILQKETRRANKHVGENKYVGKNVRVLLGYEAKKQDEEEINVAEQTEKK